MSRPRTLTRHPLREQTAADQRAAILATGDAGSVPREIICLECPDCEQMFGPQSVVEFNRVQVSYETLTRMAAYCPHCRHILIFSLIVDRATGLRQMRPVLGKRRLRGQPSIDRFLAQHPQLRGIVEA